MGRSNYSDDLEPQELARWRGIVANTIRGKRGQAFLKEMLVALENMPFHELVENQLEIGDDVCALGSVGRMRGLDMYNVDPEDSEAVAVVFGISDAMAREIMDVNDERGDYGVWESPLKRWRRVYTWVKEQIKS